MQSSTGSDDPSGEQLPQFNGYQMQMLNIDRDGFRIYQDEYGDLWLSDDVDSRGYHLPNDILSSIYREVRGGGD